ncbi:MAG: LPS export ABC transporter periplasmic protein LptC [Sediminibacterium sp.]|nr:LPS export ABC transporter periplasmic protein LptC [Sediminibacterium sp.]
MAAVLKKYFSICFVLLAITTYAQPGKPKEINNQKDTVKSKVITQENFLYILAADKQYLQKTDSNQLVSYAGHVKVRQGKTLFYADSAIINPVANTLESFGNVHINDSDSVHIYAQYLRYMGIDKKALLTKKVRLTDKKSTLTTENLTYDVNLKLGTYLYGGKVVNKKTTLTSTEGNYYGDTKDIYFYKNVLLVQPDGTIKTDSLQYNTSTEVSTFISPTVIKDKKGLTIKTREGFYDIKKKIANLYKRSIIEDSTFSITADEIAIDSLNGLSEFRGNAVYRSKDKEQGFDMIANNIKTNNKRSTIMATQIPLLIIKQGADSIFITADTLFSGRVIDLLKTKKIPNVRPVPVDTSIKKGVLKDTVKVTAAAKSPIKKSATKTAVDSIKLKTASTPPVDSTLKYFEAYKNVKIFSDSLQAVGDSLFFSGSDSVFRLFNNPIIWAQENQISGDTIYLFLKNKKPERLYVFENALSISKVDSSNYFNQVRGNSINALFDSTGQVHFLTAKGSAENIYYAQDEQKGFVGVNKNSCDLIEINFTDGKPKRVKFINNLEGGLLPMRGKTNHDELKLKSFNWQDKLRPKSKFDILTGN